jgi:uncharacterized protein (DUF2141 family)
MLKPVACSMFLASVVLADGLMPGSAAHAENVRPSEIIVNVGDFRSHKGALGCLLYHAPAGFPDRTDGAVERFVKVTTEVGQCSFENLAAGTYAVLVMHDENGNRKLDKNWLGAPKEGYGASNNHTHTFSSPTWKESKVIVASGKDVVLSIRLRY